MTKQTKFEKKVLDQIMSGKSLFGRDGAFAPILKNVIEKALEAEMKRERIIKSIGNGKGTIYLSNDEK